MHYSTVERKAASVRGRKLLYGRVDSASLPQVLEWRV